MWKMSIESFVNSCSRFLYIRRHYIKRLRVDDEITSNFFIIFITIGPGHFVFGLSGCFFHHPINAFYISVVHYHTYIYYCYFLCPFLSFSCVLKIVIFVSKYT